MDQKFKPPINHEEFLQRADKMSLAGAKGVLSALESRRKGMTTNIDAEIVHLKKIIKHKSDNGPGQEEMITV